MTTHLNYHVDLGRDSLAEVLYKLYRHRVPGVLEAKNGELIKRIYVKGGNVIYATSSDRADSLGSFLLRQRLVSKEALTEVAQERAHSRKRFGVLLMERGLLSPAMLNAAIKQQVEEIAWSLFSWDQGEIDVELHEMREGDTLRIHIPMRSMILRGLRQSADPKLVVSRIGGRETVLEPGGEPEDLIDIGVDESEYQLLKLVDGTRTLYELCHQGPLKPGENAKVLYAFYVLHLLRRRDHEAGIKKIRLRP